MSKLGHNSACLEECYKQLPFANELKLLLIVGKFISWASKLSSLVEQILRIELQRKSAGYRQNTPMVASTAVASDMNKL